MFVDGCETTVLYPVRGSNCSDLVTNAKCAVNEKVIILPSRR